MKDTPRPQWQLPLGVTRGLWEYAHSDIIADDYDAYFAENKLFDFDEQVLSRHFTKRGAWVADLGCGTGRALVPLVRRGFRGLAVDLSERMLQVVRRKAESESLPIQCVLANLVELDCLADDSIDYSMCLFSTLGMIRGWQNRQRVLDHVQRILRPGGVFVLHVHNFWYNLYDPGGPWWVISNYLRAAVRRDVEPGDKFFPYCGVNNMFLHVFTHGELRRAVRRAGFAIREMIPLDPRRVRALRWPWLLGRLRANGWIIVCEKPSQQ
jgi:ubiquinone/menaquinone biosynthesis C-methylase UbiE